MSFTSVFITSCFTWQSQRDIFPTVIWWCTGSSTYMSESSHTPTDTVLSCDERPDWLDSDDCRKWPGRWVYLQFPNFSVAYTSSPPVFVALAPWFHHGNPSTELLSSLMALLLALMHFKHTAAATSQSDRKYKSFAISPLFSLFEVRMTLLLVGALF